MPAGLLRMFSLALAGIILLELADPVCAENPIEQLEQIRKGYLANRNSIKHGKCRFIYSRWTADSEADAIAGTKNDIWEPATAEFTLYFKDDMLALKMDIENNKVMDKLGSRDVTLTPYQVSRKGEYAFGWDGLVNTVIVHSPHHRLRNIQFHPFNLAEDADGGDPATFIEVAQKHDYKGFDYDVEEQVRDGKKYLLLEIEGDPASQRTHYFLDKNRGNLPMITEWFTRRRGRKFRSRMYILDTAQSGSAFFPTHALKITPRARTTDVSYFEVREMKVTELDLNYEPTDEDLSITLPKTAQFSDGVNPNTAKTIYRGSKTRFVTVPVDDIERIYLDLQILALERLEGDKQRFLEFVTSRIPSGEFETEDRVHRRALIALTKLDITKWWNGLSDEQQEKIGSELNPFLDFVRAFAKRERSQNYVISHFGDIGNSQLKLAWAALLLQNHRSPRELVDFLNTAFESKDDAAFLAQLLGDDRPEIEATLRRISATKSGFSLEESDDKLVIHFDGRRIATYLTQHDKLTRPAWINICLPSGVQVTRNFPAQKPEDLDPGHSGEEGIIHPMMHPGIWISYGDLNGNDYWRLKSKVAYLGCRKPREADIEIDRLAFTIWNRYLIADGEGTVCTEEVRYIWQRVGEGIAIDIQTNYQSNKDFYFGDQEESGLGVRVASPLRVNGGNGTILNNRGDKNGAEVWGKEAEWVDYFGTIDGKEVGVMIVPHKNNPRRCWMHARDYGLTVANPFPRQPKERKEPYVKTPVKARENYFFGWRVLLHEMPEGESLDRKKAAAELVQ